MEKTKIIARKRELDGTSNARRMRSSGGLPGVVYGSEKAPVSVELNAHDFEQILHHAASESLLVDIDLEGEGTLSVLVKDVQHHPVTSELLHVDLMRIAANKPISVEIPLEIVGESPGVKMGGILDQVMHEIEVECLPGDLVESFDVEVYGLGIGDTLHVSDLGLDERFKLLVDADAIVVSIAAPKTADEEGEEGEEGAEPELVDEKKSED